MIRGRQRWHHWRNIAVSRCPPYGIIAINGVENSGYESFGNSNPNRLVFRGTHPGEDQQGALPFDWNYAFNGGSVVRPGEIGELTFDLPTWAAVNSGEDPAVPVPEGVIYGVAAGRWLLTKLGGQLGDDAEPEDWAELPGLFKIAQQDLLNNDPIDPNNPGLTIPIRRFLVGGLVHYIAGSEGPGDYYE